MRVPGSVIYDGATGGGVDLITMARSIHANMKNDTLKIGIARPAGTGICIAHRANDKYATVIYSDYDNPVTRIILYNGTWSKSSP